VFALFGLGRWLLHERDKASARLKKKGRVQDAAGLTKVKMALGGLGKGGRPNSRASAREGGVSSQVRQGDSLAVDPVRLRLPFAVRNLDSPKSITQTSWPA
jgi:hypothetical protein